MSVQKSKSVFWYLLPLSIGIIGGVIAFFILRKSDSHKARNCLLIGIGMTIVLMVANLVIINTILPQSHMSDYIKKYGIASVLGELMFPVIVSSVIGLSLYNYLIRKIKIKIIVYGISIVVSVGFFVLIEVVQTFGS